MKTFCCVVVEALTWFSNGVRLKTSLSGSRLISVRGSYSVPSYLRTEMKKRSSSLAGMFSVALDSFSDS